MASIVSYKRGSRTYLYESVSYRDEKGKPQNKRKLIGHLDPESGKPIYKAEYIAKMAEQGIVVESYQPPPLYSAKQICLSEVKSYGAFYLFQALAERCGLTSVLQEVFAQNWQQIFTLACFLVSSAEPALYLVNWMDCNVNLAGSSLSSQRVSELLAQISDHDRQTFYQKWATYRSEVEYLALDITSVSSYSNLIDDVEWGYNRDKEKLPMVNLCLILGEKSSLPVYQTIYSGSLKDVSTLEMTLNKVFSLSIDKLLLVMDKGFCSKANLNMMLDHPLGVRFIIALPFTLAFTKKQVESERKDIDKAENAILAGADLLRAVTKIRAWNSEHKLYVHVYYNASKATKDKESLVAHVTALRQLAKADPQNAQYKKEFDRYLIIRKSKINSEGYTINIRHDVIEKELAHAGWLVLVSNHISDKEEAINIYRSKDVVEKGFDRMKNALGLRRFRVHSDERMQNKAFVGFIALILMSCIHKIMQDKGLYRNKTMRQLIKTLDKLKLQVVAGNRLLYPVTKEQRDIYNSFDLEPPV